MNWLYTVLLLVSPLPALATPKPVATLVRAYLAAPANKNTMVAGSTLQFTAYGVYSDGSVATLPDAKGNSVTTWTSSAPQVASISTNGIATAVGAGTTNIWAEVGSLMASPWGITVTTAPKPVATLVRAYLAAPANKNTMVAGGTLQFTAYGVYSDGSVATLPDAKGNSVTAWTSSAPQAASIGTNGIATAVGAGTTNIWAEVGSLMASPWGITVTAAPKPVATLVRAYLTAPANKNTMAVGSTLQF